MEKELKQWGDLAGGAETSLPSLSLSLSVSLVLARWTLAGFCLLAGGRRLLVLVLR